MVVSKTVYGLILGSVPGLWDGCGSHSAPSLAFAITPTDGRFGPSYGQLVELLSSARPFPSDTHPSEWGACNASCCKFPSEEALPGPLDGSRSSSSPVERRHLGPETQRRGKPLFRRHLGGTSALAGHACCALAACRGRRPAAANAPAVREEFLTRRADGASVQHVAGMTGRSRNDAYLSPV